MAGEVKSEEGRCGRGSRVVGLSGRVQLIDVHLTPQPSHPHGAVSLPRITICPLINTPINTPTHICHVYIFGPIHDELTRIDQLPYPIALQHRVTGLQVKISVR